MPLRQNRLGNKIVSLSNWRVNAPRRLPGLTFEPEFRREVQPPASLNGLDDPSRRAVFVPRKPSRRRGVRNGKPDFLLRNQCCRRGCTSRRNPPLCQAQPQDRALRGRER
jgi:hypothetical protein